MRTKPDVTTMMIQQMNQYCEEGKWFWVCGLARETWAGLLPVIDQLHEVAQDAVRHYAEQGS